MEFSAERHKLYIYIYKTKLGTINEDVTSFLYFTVLSRKIRVCSLMSKERDDKAGVGNRERNFHKSEKYRFGLRSEFQTM